MLRRTIASLACSLAAASAGTVSAAVAPPVTGGLILGLDASNVTTSGTAVTRWNDQSSATNHAIQATVGARPTVSGVTTPTGLGTIDFDGIDDYLQVGSSSSFDSTGGLTWFVVFNADANLSSPRLLNAAYGDINPAAATQLSYQAWGAAVNGTTYRSISRTPVNATTEATTAGGAINLTDFFVGSGRVAATGHVYSEVMDQAGVSTATSSAGTATTSFAAHLFTRIGAGTSAFTASTPGVYFDGQLAEVLVYNRGLSNAEMDQVQAYLHTKHLVVPEPASAALCVAGLLLLRPRR